MSVTKGALRRDYREIIIVDAFNTILPWSTEKLLEISCIVIIVRIHVRNLPTVSTSNYKPFQRTIYTFGYATDQLLESTTRGRVDDVSRKFKIYCLDIPSAEMNHKIIDHPWPLNWNR